MIVVCSYCRHPYAHKPGTGTSHGVCPTCYRVIQLDLDSGGNCDPEDIRAVVDLRLPACQRSGGL